MWIWSDWRIWDLEWRMSWDWMLKWWLSKIELEEREIRKKDLEEAG